MASQCNRELLDEMLSWALMQSLDDPATSDELVVIMDKMKWGKIGGKTGILPELILCGGPVLKHRLLVLMKEMLSAVSVVKD